MSGHGNMYGIQKKIHFNKIIHLSTYIQSYTYYTTSEFGVFENREIFIYYIIVV